jgi:prepilin-type N-terminal cleavage/methylation domain-containing protein
MVLAKSSWTAERGFSLLEVLIATTILTVGVATLAQLFALSTRANASARTTTFAAVLAEQKMEQIRSLTFGFDNLALPITDITTDLTKTPEAGGGKGLSPSPEKTLQQNTLGYCDFIDQFGNSLGGGTVPPNNTVYIRRWSIEPMPTNPNNTLVIQVLVTRLRNRGTADDVKNVKRLPDEARVVTVKTRKAT